MSDRTNAQIPFCVSSSPTAGPTISGADHLEVPEIPLAERRFNGLRLAS